MNKYILVAAGGAIGSVVRYFISSATISFFQSAVFPLGTLIVNLTGSFIIGVLAGMDDANYLSPNLKIFLFIGILGGYTTFSSFSLETINLFKSGKVSYAMINIFASNILGVLLAFAGFFGLRYFSAMIK